MIGRSGLALLGVMSGFGFKGNEVQDFSKTASNPKGGLPFRISLNTSTISAYNLNVEEQIELVAEAGFDGIELWVRDVEAYIKEGGSAEIVSEKLKSNNLVLENMIGFAPWFSEHVGTRKQGVNQLYQEMEMTSKLGGKYIAAPVQGIKALNSKNFADYAQRYLDILELGDQTGVFPILELWGAGALSRLADCAKIVIATGHPESTMLLDFYHLYRGGNDWDTLDCLNGGRLPVFHINDYPQNPGRKQLEDSDRVFPGDGICPFDELIPKLYKAGFRGAFSVELFNEHYWKTMDAPTILRKSYDKTYDVLKDSMTDID